MKSKVPIKVYRDVIKACSFMTVRKCRTAQSGHPTVMRRGFDYKTGEKLIYIEPFFPRLYIYLPLTNGRKERKLLNLLHLETELL